MIVDQSGSSDLAALAQNATELWQSRKPAEAVAAFQQLLAAQPEQPADLVLAQNLPLAHNLAWFALRAGGAALAHTIYQRIQRLDGSPKPVESLEWRRLGVFLTQQTTPPAAQVEQFCALHALALEQFGESDPRTRVALREVADAQAGAERYDDALKTYNSVFTAELDANDQLTAADIATDLGRLLDRIHRYADAFSAHYNAFLIRRAALGDYDERTNRSCYEVAELSRVLSRLDEAVYYFTRALDMENAGGGSDTDLGALIRNNLGEVYASLGRYNDARVLLDEALQMRVRLYGEDSERAWRTRLAQARQLRASRDPAAALELADRALEHAPAESHSAWYHAQAGALLDSGDAAGAEEIYAAMYDQIPVSEIDHGITLDGYLDVLEGLTRCRMARSSWAEAADSASRVLDIAQTQLLDLTHEAAEAQVVHVLHAILAIQSLLLISLWRGSITEPHVLAKAFELVQLTKGFRTRYVRTRQPGVGNLELIIPAEDQERVSKTVTRISQLNSELIAEHLALGDARQFGAARSVIAKRAELRSLERQLAGGVGDAETIFELIPVLSETMLPEGTAGLEILLVQDVVGERLGQSPLAHRYMAFTLAPGSQTPALFDIGLADEIDQAIGELRTSLMNDVYQEGAPAPDWVRLARFLGRKVLRDCWPQLQSAKAVAVGPDGAFGALPLELLTTPDGGYLIDRTQVSYCLRVGEMQRSGQMLRKGDAPLVLAGPDFDLPRAFTGNRQQVTLPSHTLQKLAGSTRFATLDAAREEGAEIARILGVEALTGVWALSSELFRNRSQDIIHISTHGFVLPRTDLQDDPLSLAEPVGNALDKRMVLEDSLQRSGLAFAGANAVLDGRTIPSVAGDGIVYASDIQQLNLQQTDLVVLGACRSGLGDLTPGDGAHGLRRAFLAAGCRSVVSALWDVPDASSRKLLTTFYDSLIKGHSRLAALADARVAVRAEHPNDPIHWAGFVLDGRTDQLWRFSGVADLKIASLSMRAWGIRSANDADAIKTLAQRIVKGDQSNATLSISLARQALAREDLTDDQRADLLYWHGDLANRLGDNTRAIADFQNVIEMKGTGQGGRAALKYNIAKIRHQDHQLDEAIAGYTDALADASSAQLRAAVRVNRGMAFYVKGDFAAARADLSAVIDDSAAPDDQRWMARMNRAEINREDDPDSALSDIDAALGAGLAAEGETLKLRAFRVELLVRVGRLSDARAESATLTVDPQLPDELRAHLSYWEQQTHTAIPQTVDLKST